MKSRNKQIPLLLISVSFLICSCLQKRNEQSENMETIYVEKKLVEKEVDKNLDSSKTRNGILNLTKALAIGLEKKGTNDSLVLSVSATRNEKDEIIWDDSQIWRVHLKSESGYSLIYEKDIQLGKLEVYLDRSENLVFLVENAPYQKSIYEINLSENDLALDEIEKLPEISNYESITFE